MKKTIILTIIRVLLGLWLVWMIYGEAGRWTALFALLTLVGTEYQTHHDRTMRGIMFELIQLLKQLMPRAGGK